MPYCEVVKEHVDAETTLNNAGVKIFYRTYGHGPSKALLIIGLSLSISELDFNWVSDEILKGFLFLCRFSRNP
ncbi:hypothetical protein F2Q68_00021535 [Brassica cretica]|uniref:Uncharacterized protein n=1 Tax=Brassica cretica TaxID=69181 RepID=A0A8S9FXN6_BRACR|nr:hypothetical protein F2Q68_00021535 [Brassica cretica]